MIQSTLFFILGFLTAGFLALLVAPSIWRRAVALTRRRIEASVPLTMDEIQAEKDSLRAQFAMSTRRLEMSVKSSRHKAAEQSVEINRNREEIKRLTGERDGKIAALGALETQAGELRDELRRREERLQELNDTLAGREKQLEERVFELEQLGRMYDEASFNASSRQIEVVTQETKIDRLNSDIGVLRGERKDAEARAREMAADSKAAREALRAERRKITNLEKKAERLMTSVSDLEEKLERRERELERLRARTNEGGEVETDRSADEPARPEGDRKRLEDRLTVLVRENKRLREELDDARDDTDGDRDERERQNGALREQIQELAADVVNLAATLDGPDSPIRKALENAPPIQDVGEGGIASLAERVRALQKAAASR